MSAPTLAFPDLIALRPCSERLAIIRSLIGDAETWNGRPVTAAEAVAAGASFYDLLWAACALARTDADVERRMRLWMADCAARVLHIFESAAPTDARVRDCIVAAQRFARGEIDGAAMASARDDAVAAATDAAAGAASAWTAARAWAAASAGAAGAGDAAGGWAAIKAWDAVGDDRGAAEQEWQLARLVSRLSDPEPEDWKLPDRRP